MSDQISKIDAKIARLKKQRAELLALERKARERALLRSAEKCGLLTLPLEQLERIFSNLPNPEGVSE